MEKNEIISKINTLVEMLYITGQKKGLHEAGEIFTSGSVKIERQSSATASVLGSDKPEGSDPHPVMPPIKPWKPKINFQVGMQLLQKKRTNEQKRRRNRVSLQLVCILKGCAYNSERDSNYWC
jgi:hypothetical protein